MMRCCWYILAVMMQVVMQTSVVMIVAIGDDGVSDRDYGL